MGRRGQGVGAGRASNGGRGGCHLSPGGSACARPAGDRDGRPSRSASPRGGPGRCIEFPVPCPDSDAICRVRQAKEDRVFWFFFGITGSYVQPIFQSCSYHHVYIYSEPN